MPTISACIVAYCDYEEVCAAVRSILHFTPAPDFTLYIVDNASPDGCGKQLADTDWADPRAGALPAGERRLCRGQRRVWQLHSSVHFILNPDIVLTGDIFAADAEWVAGSAGDGHGYPAAAPPRRPLAAPAPGASPPWLLARQLAPVRGGAFKKPTTTSWHHAGRDLTAPPAHRVLHRQLYGCAH